MQNIVYRVTNFLVELFRENPIVATITFDKTGEIDFDKNNVFPLVNIDLVDSDPVSEVLNFNYIVTILQDRDIDNEVNNNKLLYQDNLIDNLGECYDIGIRVINFLKYEYNEDEVEMIRHSNIVFLKREQRNILDGVTFNLTISIENESICESGIGEIRIGDSPSC
jgi:hypothetical protein